MAIVQLQAYTCLINYKDVIQLNKLIKGLVIAAVALGVGSTAGMTDAQAKRHYTTIPTSIRGTWYRHNSYYGGYDKIILSKYTFKSESSKQGAITKISGTKFRSYNQGHSDLYVSNKNSHGYYLIGLYASDGFSYWKHTTHNRHSALKIYTPIPGGSPMIQYAYHFKR